MRDVEGLVDTGTFTSQVFLVDWLPLFYEFDDLIRLLAQVPVWSERVVPALAVLNTIKKKQY